MNILYLTVDQLLPGMIVVDDVLLPDKTELMSKQTVLSVKHILKLKMYNIGKVPCLVPENVAKAVDKASVSHWNTVRNTAEFKNFSRDYRTTVLDLRAEFQTISDPACTKYDMNRLTDMVYRLTDSSYSATHIFDLLHCMRDFDDSIYVHCLNVALIAHSIGIWLNLDAETLNQPVLSGVVHDIGKLNIPTNILTKPGKLTDEEFEIIKRHPDFGLEIMKKFSNLDPRVLDGVSLHHERNDGSGYPNHLTAGSIPAFAKILAIADVYDAMTAKRQYRDSISPFEVVANFEKDGYTKFETQYLLPFLEHIANAYIGVPVLLSNGLVGEVVMINRQKLSCPMVQVGTEFIDLTKWGDLKIKALC
ncbi:MAG: HD-GYP domain-containing protein [Lachnospiraceae bacterium]|nr:HD-GYP domain-containing protein [Lachnospiraceae bacterium]